MLRIVPFFSPIAPETLRKNVVQQITDTPEIILYPESRREIDFDADFFIYFIGTGGTENAVAEFISTYKPSTPINLISYDLNNSLPAAMETRTYLANLGYDVQIIHTSFGDVRQRIHKIEQLCAVKEKMEQVTLGMVGEPSEWLIASEVNRQLVSDFWGIVFVDIPINESAEELNDRIDENIFENATNSFVTDLEISKASSVAAKLTSIVSKYKLQALSIKCFDLLSLTDNITACCGLSHLNDLGVVAGCEGDIPATVTMAFLTYLTNTAPFMANITHVDEVSNHIKIAHCTVPTSIVEDYDLISHFESDKSVGIRGRFKTDVEVTICKLFGPALTDYWIGTGTLLSNISDELACRTQVEIRLYQNVDYFLKKSLANHHIMVLGDYSTEIRMFFELFGRSMNK